MRCARMRTNEITDIRYMVYPVIPKTIYYASIFGGNDTLAAVRRSKIYREQITDVYIHHPHSTPRQSGGLHIVRIVLRNGPSRGA